MNNVFYQFGMKTIQLNQHFWEMYLLGQTTIQNFVPFGHYVGRRFLFTIGPGESSCGSREYKVAEYLRKHSETLRENCPNMEYFLFRIFLYSVRIQENTDQKNL